MGQAAEGAPRWYAHHFHNAQQQLDSVKLGMWAFLVQEILFFGGLFMAYVAFRYFYPETYLHAHTHLDWRFGGVNTIVLLFSSVTMALAVRACATDDENDYGGVKWQKRFLWATFACGAIFMIVKLGWEWYPHIEDGLSWGKFYSYEGIEGMPHIFFSIYYAMTGTHGLHVVIGMAIILLWLLPKAGRGDFTPNYHPGMENFGLYWHLVDLIWIFLFPLFYLVK